MMATTYKKNNRGLYRIPIYSKFNFWLILLVVIGLILILVTQFIEIRLYVISFWVLILIFIIIRLFLLFKEIKDYNGVAKYIKCKKFEQYIIKSLLSTMTLNKLKDTPYISVPKVTVGDSLPEHLTVKIEKLPGMYDVEKLAEDVTSSFRKKYSKYAVTSYIISADGNYYNFILEDVGTDKTWIPRTIEDLKNKPYMVTLQKGLTINLSEKPHIAIWGKTGSKKTTTILGIILQLLPNSDIRFLDFKNEYSAFASFYPLDKIVNEIEKVQPLLEEILEIIRKRQKLMSEKSRKLGKLGLNASDIGLKPLVLIADEVGSIVALMDSKQQKKFISSLTAIIQRGRSVGVNLIIGTQSPSVDVLPQSVRSNFSTKILLGSANSEIQRMAFGEVATNGNVEDFRGYYASDGLTIQPMKFYVNDLYSYGFNKLTAFQKAYGLSKERR